MACRIARYTHTRFWALWEDDELVCVTVDKKGAPAVQQRLAAPPLGCLSPATPPP